MTPHHRRAINQAMVNRADQWALRVGIGALIALAFFPLVGQMFAVGWLTVYGLLQAVELRFQAGSKAAAWLGEERYAWACLALVVVNNMVFGALGAAQALGGTVTGLLCASLLTSGAIINAVTVSHASRRLLAASLAPQAVYLAFLPIGAYSAGVELVPCLQIALAAAFIFAGGLVMAERLAVSLRSMEAAQHAAEDANSAKSAFLATMSHEIRTPLNGVLGMAQAMAADDLSERQRERLDVVSQSGQALLVILSDVLDLAKIEAGKVELELAAFDLETLVQRSQETFLAVAESKGLDVETRIDTVALGTWRGDTNRLRQILTNLISNAVKFTDEGRVTVTASAAGDGLRFVVEDTGPGVTPEQLQRLFMKFVQADASTTRQYGGTGLGLSICAELALLMGGSITADHVEPHGLRFTFRVPVERIDAERCPEAVSAVVSTDGRTEVGRRLRVLAAEDHPVNRQVLTLLLSQAGIIPHIVEDGAKAVQAWREGAPDGPWDLILMDVQMPVMDGPTAARRIRAEERTMGRVPVPIIALTANVMTHQIEDYKQAGMESFVAKPIQVEALLTGIEAALARVSGTETCGRPQTKDRRRHVS